MRPLILQSATEDPGPSRISISRNGLHFLPRLPFSWQYQQKKLNIFWPKLHCQFHCSPQLRVAPLCRPLTVPFLPPPPPSNRETDHHTLGTTHENVLQGQYIFLFSYLYSKLWVTVLSAEYLSLTLHASVTNPFNKGALINLLRQFAQVGHFYCRITRSRNLTKYLRPRP